MTADQGYWAVTIDEGKDGARKAFVQRYGREPQETLNAGTAWLAGPIPGAAPMFADASPESEPAMDTDVTQGRLF